MMAAVIPLPRWLNWKVETQKLEPVTRQVFWMYAGYILMTNLSIGFITLVFAETLLNGTALVTALTGFMLAYWAVRLILQLFVIDKTAAPKGLLFTFGDLALTLLFLFFTTTYALAFVYNLRALNP